MEKLYIFIFFISTPLIAQTINPLTNYTFEHIVENEEASYIVLEGCVSLYSAL